MNQLRLGVATNAGLGMPVTGATPAATTDGDRAPFRVSLGESGMALVAGDGSPHQAATEDVDSPFTLPPRTTQTMAADALAPRLKYDDGQLSVAPHKDLRGVTSSPVKVSSAAQKPVQGAPANALEDNAPAEQELVSTDALTPAAQAVVAPALVAGTQPRSAVLAAPVDGQTDVAKPETLPDGPVTKTGKKSDKSAVGKGATETKSAAKSVISTAVTVPTPTLPTTTASPLPLVPVFSPSTPAAAKLPLVPVTGLVGPNRLRSTSLTTEPLAAESSESTQAAASTDGQPVVALEVVKAVAMLSQQVDGSSAQLVSAPAFLANGLTAKAPTAVAAKKKEASAEEGPIGAPIATMQVTPPDKASSGPVLATPGEEHQPATASVALPALAAGIAAVPHVAGTAQAAADVRATPSPTAAHPSALVADAAPSAGMSGQEPSTLAATPRVLEVGVDSGTHGWLRLRAEMGTGGEVTASVVASSSSAAQTLHRELPELNAYLSREQVSVASVNISSATANPQPAGTGLAADAGGQRHGSDQPARQQGPGSSGGAPVEFGAVPDVALTPSLYSQRGGGGGWVNVRV